jgi:hypothetical protein
LRINVRNACVGQRRHDEQHRVRTGGARLDELEFRDDEIFTQEWQINSRAHRGQVLETAIEERRFREDRNRRGAGARVTGCDDSRLILAAQHTLRRRSALALRNHAQTGFRQGLLQAARGRGWAAAGAALDARRGRRPLRALPTRAGRPRRPPPALRRLRSFPARLT